MNLKIRFRFKPVFTLIQISKKNSYLKSDINGQAAGGRNSLLPFSFLYRCKSTTFF